MYMYTTLAQSTWTNWRSVLIHVKPITALLFVVTGQVGGACLCMAVCGIAKAIQSFRFH